MKILPIFVASAIVALILYDFSIYAFLPLPNIKLMDETL